MLDLNKYGRDVRGFVKKLENWIIHVLSKFNLKGFTRSDRIGVWVNGPNTSLGGMDKSNEYKIAAIGIRLRKWVSFHGISINVNPDLTYYEGIVPCGIKEHGVTSFNHLGLSTSMKEVDHCLKTSFQDYFSNLGKSPQL
jgi:lipoyl(octanoyl) transferase